MSRNSRVRCTCHHAQAPRVAPLHTARQAHFTPTSGPSTCSLCLQASPPSVSRQEAAKATDPRSLQLLSVGSTGRWKPSLWSTDGILRSTTARSAPRRRRWPGHGGRAHDSDLTPNIRGGRGPVRRVLDQVVAELRTDRGGVLHLRLRYITPRNPSGARGAARYAAQTPTRIGFVGPSSWRQRSTAFLCAASLRLGRRCKGSCCTYALSRTSLMLGPDVMCATRSGNQSLERCSQYSSRTRVSARTSTSS